MIAYAMLHNCLETSFVHGIHFVWVLMLLGMMNILYTHANKPKLIVGFNEPKVSPGSPTPGSNNGTEVYAGAVRDG